MKYDTISLEKPHASDVRTSEIMCQICWNIQNTNSYCSRVIYMLFSLFSMTREFTESIRLQHVKCTMCKWASQSYLYNNREC